MHSNFARALVITSCDSKAWAHYTLYQCSTPGWGESHPSHVTDKDKPYVADGDGWCSAPELYPQDLEFPSIAAPAYDSRYAQGFAGTRPFFGYGKMDAAYIQHLFLAVNDDLPHPH